MAQEKPYMTKLLGKNEVVEDDSNDYNRKNTFAADGRKTTFSRAFTFDGEALRTISQPFSGLTRTLTEVGLKFDPDAQFTKSVIQEYVKHSEAGGHEGDIPLPPGFARKADFWRLLLLVAIVASIMGIVSAAFMNFGDEVSPLVHILLLHICDLTHNRYPSNGRAVILQTT